MFIREEIWGDQYRLAITADLSYMYISPEEKRAGKSHGAEWLRAQVVELMLADNLGFCHSSARALGCHFTFLGILLLYDLV